MTKYYLVDYYGQPIDYVLYKHKEFAEKKLRREERFLGLPVYLEETEEDYIPLNI